MFENMEAIIEIAVATLGLTEAIKNFVSVKHKYAKKIYAAMSLIVGTIVVYIKWKLPESVMLGIIGVSMATEFYDTIYSGIEDFIRSKTNKLKDDIKLIESSTDK